MPDVVTVVSSDLVQPIVTAITTNLGVLLPIGITIMGVFIGISLIPRVVYKFL